MNATVGIKKWATLAAVGTIASGMAMPAMAIDIIDLTSGTPANNSVNGAYLFATDPQSTGTGVIDPFLREQADGSEQGINTSISKPPFDDKSGPWTHDLLVSQLGEVTYNDVLYYQFYLDANQVGDGPISMNAFQVFVTSGSPFTDASDLINLVSSGTPSFDLNGGSPGSVRVDINSNTGSGSGDMYILVPVSDIGTSGDLYLYAEFGEDASGGGYASNDGFEEWSAYEGPQVASVPGGDSTAFLLSAALMGLAMVKRRIK